MFLPNIYIGLISSKTKLASADIWPGFFGDDAIAKLPQQVLRLLERNTPQEPELPQALESTYPVSTSKYGVGNEEYSKKTPLGTHSILERIGEAARIGAIFESRENTGRIATIYTDTTDIEEELITTRILLLKGMVPGLNEGGGVDSYARRIYIHGTPEEGLIGNPASNGCVRMRNEDIMELFDIVPRGALVRIHE